MRLNTPRRKGRVIAGPFLRLKKLPQSLRKAIGTTGTGVRSTMRDAGAEGVEFAVSVIRPSGKRPTS